MSPIDTTNRKSPFNLFSTSTILAILACTLVPGYIILVIKIAGLSGVLSASRGALTLFVINFIFQFPVHLYNILVLRKQDKELTTSQIDKLKISTTLIAAIGAFLLNRDQLRPILYFATYLLASNRIVAYLDVKLNLSKMQVKLALFAMDFSFILLGTIDPAIKSGVVPLLVFIILLKITTDGAEYARKRLAFKSERIIHDIAPQLPKTK